MFLSSTVEGSVWIKGNVNSQVEASVYSANCSEDDEQDDIERFFLNPLGDGLLSGGVVTTLIYGRFILDILIVSLRFSSTELVHVSKLVCFNLFSLLILFYLALWIY